jgi:transcriptional regulator with XRE-family HTH domain
MTLDAVAGQAGITKGSLSKIENGNANLERRKTIKAIADALLSLETQRLAEIRINCQDGLVGHALPPLLKDLHAAATTDNNDRLPALQSLVQATNSTAHFLKNLGAVDLAWVAAERGHQAAQLLEDPVYLAAADYARAQALIGLGAYDRADAIARNAVSLLTPDGVTATEVYGTNVSR